ncbi:MAG TPA: sigma-70 family RNA polymerase sigma factor [Kofleriaceae bacterium]|nr:sigma-70 family RNA polymerase sigma factor [Kofleriaceae bacterium]
MGTLKTLALSPDLGERERQYIFSVAMKYLKDEDAAEDVTQDAMLLAHRHRDGFRGDSRFSTWLYRVAATTALMYLRHRRRKWREVSAAARPDEEHSATSAPATEHVDPTTGADERVAACEGVALLDRRLRAMGDRYRDVFWLRFAGGYSEAEIAELLGVQVSTVKTRTHRARKALHDALDPELGAIAA